VCEIETTIDRAADLTVHTVSGDVTAPEIVDALHRYFAGVPTKYILWDLCEADLTGLTASDVRMIAQTARRYTHLRPGGRTALLACSDFVYGLGRMLEQTLSASESPVEAMTFHDRDAALAWLGQGEAG
jgi:hypothetical protein